MFIIIYSTSTSFRWPRLVTSLLLRHPFILSRLSSILWVLTMPALRMVYHSEPIPVPCFTISSISMGLDEHTPASISRKRQMSRYIQ
nr:hypothetical protein I308_00930 [Cryptococcus tetragattii IND107]